MGKRERRSFSEEFKREAVALATQSTGSVSEVARQLGVASSSLTRWVRQAKAHGTKAAGAGTELPWHQDDGRFWGIDRRPSLQVWTALDDAPEDSGCLEVVPGTHLHGLASPEGGTVQPHNLAARGAGELGIRLPARAGEAILVHNHLWHRSGRNHTAAPRRAVSISFLDGATRCLRRRRAPRRFMPLFNDPVCTGNHRLEDTR